MTAGVIIFVFLILSSLFGTPDKRRGKHAKKRLVMPRAAVPKLVLSSPVLRSDIRSASTVSTSNYQSAEDAEFERCIEMIYGARIDKQFYSKVAGVTFSNEDGVSRKTLIARCKTFETVTLEREPENPYGATAIRVMNADGLKLGYLHKETSEQLSWDIDRYHREWLAIVRHAFINRGPEPSALILILLRVKCADAPSSVVDDIGFREKVGCPFDRCLSSRLNRTSGLNEDGSDRQQLVDACAENQRLHLRRELENGSIPNAVAVVNEGAGRLGYLDKRVADEIAAAMDAGETWAAVISRIHAAEPGKRIKLSLLVFRPAAEKSAARSTG